LDGSLIARSQPASSAISYCAALNWGCWAPILGTRKADFLAAALEVASSGRRQQRGASNCAYVCHHTRFLNSFGPVGPKNTWPPKSKANGHWRRRRRLRMCLQLRRLVAAGWLLKRPPLGRLNGFSG